MYFWICSNEDGTRVEPMTATQLQTRLDESTSRDIDEEYHPVFLSAIPESDKGCWYAPENAVVIIKGDVFIPTLKTVVTKYVIDG